jgi:hypothetical protein
VRGRRGLAWLSGAAGAVGLYGLARRLRRASASPVAPAGDEVDARAAELRRKLDESRAVVGEREEFESGETTVDRAEPAAEVRERRERVYDEARAAVAEMRGDPANEAPPRAATENEAPPL